MSGVFPLPISEFCGPASVQALQRLRPEQYLVAGTAIPVGFVNNIQRRWQNQMNGTGALDFTLSEKDQFRFRYVQNEVDRNWTGTALVGLADAGLAAVADCQPGPLSHVWQSGHE